ncbi:hypothetical protein DEO72_LG5g1254 [Vigna unguiculata]|uniref:Uncharacterized protein n=1 Tax=Vigna unguiculata TaxID=3917 RepID=A0A4D6LWC4_VIGUN|nr:hypothetical protein DEO72_LG5g1254 [Vigna unguiculata]
MQNTPFKLNLPLLLVQSSGVPFGAPSLLSVLNAIVAAMEVLLAVADLRSRVEELAVTATNGDAQMLIYNAAKIRVRCGEAHGGAADLWWRRREKMVKVRTAAMIGSSPATSDGGWRRGCCVELRLLA